MQFADDLSYLNKSKDNLEIIKKETSDKLKLKNLTINNEKTEFITINKENEDWKNCKYLGSYLGTEKDIKHRKQLSMAAFLKYQSKLQSNKLSLKTRMKMFNTYITSIFLYNSELWTLTKKLENEIDTFQRRLLRKILKIKYPYKISNENLYKRTLEISWSSKITSRRLRWAGHLLRLPHNTPVSIAFKEANKHTKIQKKNKKTWKKIVNNDLIQLSINRTLEGEDIRELAENREWWRSNVVERSLRCSPRTEEQH
jgi:transcription antitermination factor NusG